MREKLYQGNMKSEEKKKKPIKRNQIEILEPKDTITKAKISVDDLNSITERKEERISEMRTRTMYITQSEWQKKKRTGGKTVNRASGTYETITKDLIW